MRLLKVLDGSKGLAAACLNRSLLVEVLIVQGCASMLGCRTTIPQQPLPGTILLEPSKHGFMLGC